MTNPYNIGDPVMDLSQARPMVVLNAPETTVKEWSERNGYELEENYANEKLGADPDEYIVECAYVSNIRSEPSRDYCFPASRVVLIDAHHADDGRRVYDRVARDVLETLFRAALAYEDSGAPDVADLRTLANNTGLDMDVVAEARELADVAQRFDGGADE